jgi:hypothetical protein
VSLSRTSAASRAAKKASLLAAREDDGMRPSMLAPDPAFVGARFRPSPSGWMDRRAPSPQEPADQREANLTLMLTLGRRGINKSTGQAEPTSRGRASETLAIRGHRDHGRRGEGDALDRRSLM